MSVEDLEKLEQIYQANTEQKKPQQPPRIEAPQSPPPPPPPPTPAFSKSKQQMTKSDHVGWVVAACSLAVAVVFGLKMLGVI